MKEKETLLEKLGRYISMAGTAILMNLLFLAACLPIVTIGQAWCGLLGALRYNIRGEKWIQGFKIGYKTRFLRGTAAWCIGLLAGMFLLNDINHAMVNNAVVPLIGSCIMFAIAAMLLMSSLCLNVYIPTSVSDWIKNTVNLTIRGCLPLLVCAGLFWLPVLVALLWDVIFVFFEAGMIFLCAYFTLIALATTMLMKDHLVWVLLEARATGTLTAEEGLMPSYDEEDGE